MDKESVGCGCGIVLIIANIIFGAMSVNYLLMEFWSKTIPFFWAAVIGLFAGEVTMPVAVIVWILKFCHVI
jgi:hypothetical protein